MSRNRLLPWIGPWIGLWIGGVGAVSQPVWGQSAQSSLLPGRVEAILGGDNLLIQINGDLVNVDLANISPPWDATTNWDQEAARRLAEILPPGTSVMVDPAWQMGEQLYGYVYTAEGLVNLQLLREGVSLPRGIPRGETLQQWFQTATQSAQNTGLGYWRESMATSTAPSLSGPPFPPPAAAYWGLGGAVAWVALIAVGLRWKTWHRDPQRLRRRQQQQAQRQLPHVLTTQKKLERQHQHLLAQIDQCMHLAESAVLVGNDVKARQALVQKRLYHHQAEALSQEIGRLQQQVEQLRHVSSDSSPQE